MATDITTRGQLFRWLGWFAVANAVVLGVVDLRYLGGGFVAMTPLSWLYLVTIYASHHMGLVLLPLLLPALLLILLKPSYKPLRSVLVILMSVMIALIVLDSLLWAQGRFHLNGLTLKILGLKSWVFVIVMFFVAMLFESLLAGRIWSWLRASPSRHGYTLAGLLVACFVIAQAIFVWADATYYTPVTALARQLPVQRGFTAKKFLVRQGLVDISQSHSRQLAHRLADAGKTAASGDLSYPLKPLQCAAEKPPNLLIILVDAMRSDMLASGLTPRLDRFASQRATRFLNHYSGGNSSRMGVFSLFYGLPPGYFGSFEAQQIPPVLVNQLLAAGYQPGLFSSSNMYRPVALDRTAFARVPNLRIETRPVDAPAWKRDRIMTGDWFEWLLGRDTARPFFGFLFYDAVNAKSFPPDSAQHTEVDPGDALAEKFAAYRTAIMFDDALIGQLLDDLNQRGLLDNTVVLITADHGEEFNENHDGITGHGSGYSRFQLGVPMLLAWPGRKPGIIERRSSHYDVAPTLAHRLLGCDNPAADYSIGHDLYAGPQWDWLVAGSYFNYAVLEPGQVTVTFPGGLFEVRDNHYRLLEKPQFNPEILEAVMVENRRFYK